MKQPWCKIGSIGKVGLSAYFTLLIANAILRHFDPVDMPELAIIALPSTIIFIFASIMLGVQKEMEEL